MTHWSDIKTEMLNTGDIAIGEPRMRALQPDKVDGLVESFRAIGQLVPITVYSNPSGASHGYTLIAGNHRLEAARKLGKGILARIDRNFRSADKSKLAEIAENLHRAELTAAERAEQIAEWVKITDKLAQVAPVSKGGRGNEGGVNKASRELGIERTEVQRSIKIASLTPEAKAAAKEAGLDNNKSALLTAAKQPPEKQADRVRELAQTKLAPAAPPPPRISAELVTALKGKKATLTSWMRQHADDGIPAVMAAFAANIAVIERLIS